jgi:hypothetical protein
VYNTWTIYVMVERMDLMDISSNFSILIGC